MTRSLILLFFVLFSLTAESQLVNRRQRTLDRTPGTTTEQKLPEFNVEKAIGLSIYDVERVTKKLSIKKSSDKFAKVKSIFKKFNSDQRQLLRINTFSFNEAKTQVEAAQRTVLENRDYSVLERVYKQVSDGFKPITEQVEKREKALDESLKPLLSEKQFNKWKKLQKKIKRKG